MYPNSISKIKFEWQRNRNKYYIRIFINVLSVHLSAYAHARMLLWNALDFYMFALFSCSVVLAIFFHLDLLFLVCRILRVFFNSVHQKYNNNWNALVSANGTMLISVVADRFWTKRHCNLIIIIITNKKNVHCNEWHNKFKWSIKTICALHGRAHIPFFQYYYCCWCIHFSSVLNVFSTFFYYENHLPEMKLYIYNESRCDVANRNNMCIRFVVGHFLTSA